MVRVVQVEAEGEEVEGVQFTAFPFKPEVVTKEAEKTIHVLRLGEEADGAGEVDGRRRSSR